jgi:hypothetical protein
VTWSDNGKTAPTVVIDTNPDHFDHAIAGYGISPDYCFTNAHEALRRVQADYAIIAVAPRKLWSASTRYAPNTSR